MWAYNYLPPHDVCRLLYVVWCHDVFVSAFVYLKTEESCIPNMQSALVVVILRSSYWDCHPFMLIQLISLPAIHIAISVPLCGCRPNMRETTKVQLTAMSCDFFDSSKMKHIIYLHIHLMCIHATQEALWTRCPETHSPYVCLYTFVLTCLVRGLPPTCIRVNMASWRARSSSCSPHPHPHHHLVSIFHQQNTIFDTERSTCTTYFDVLMLC